MDDLIERKTQRWKTTQVLRCLSLNVMFSGDVRLSHGPDWATVRSMQDRLVLGALPTLKQLDLLRDAVMEWAQRAYGTMSEPVNKAITMPMIEDMAWSAWKVYIRGARREDVVVALALLFDEREREKTG
jgi:hypothetical protein